MTPYVVVIPSNNGKRLNKCIGSISDTHPVPPEIIVINDGINCWKDFHFKLKISVIHGSKPFIYARNVNQGINHPLAKDKDIIILGDDVTIKSKDCFEWLRVSSDKRNIAAVSPVVHGMIGNPFQRYNDPAFLFESPKELCFVCVYLKREWINKVGLLDEDFVYYGGEDIDWCIRAKKLGGRLMIDGRCEVTHNEPGMESEFRKKPNIFELSEKGNEILKKKWPERFP